MLPLLTKLKIRPFPHNPRLEKDAVVIGYNPEYNEYISAYEMGGESKMFSFYAGGFEHDRQVDVL